jgi:hypothetical protein
MDEFGGRIIPALKDVIKGLEERIVREHKFHFISRRSRQPLEGKISGWKSGAGPKPKLSPKEFKVAIFATSRPARELETFITVSAISTVELAKVAALEFEKGNIVAPSNLLRSIIERIGHAAALLNSVEKLPKISPPMGSNAMKPLDNLSEIITLSLFGTRIDWEKLANIDFRSISAKKAKNLNYQEMELAVDLGKIDNILKSIDKLDKLVPGSRLAYNVLCEFMHPNVGDFYGAMVNSYSFTDYNSLRHLTFELGIKSKSLSGAPQLNIVMTNLMGICSDILHEYPKILKELDVISDYAIDMTQLNIHRALRRNRNIFRNSDPCPCLSGLTVRRCIRNTRSRRRIKNRAMVHRGPN